VNVCNSHSSVSDCRDVLVLLVIIRQALILRPQGVLILVQKKSCSTTTLHVGLSSVSQ
jgi:hypothetical protein